MSLMPLWLEAEGHGPRVIVRLARCKNCGKEKITSDPCGFDHLAAILEWRNSWHELRGSSE